MVSSKRTIQSYIVISSAFIASHRFGEQVPPSQIRPISYDEEMQVRGDAGDGPT